MATTKFTGRARAREQMRKANDKAKQVLEAVQKNVNRNMEVLTDFADSVLAEDDDHDVHTCATDMCAASVAWWGNAMDLCHDIMKACAPDKDRKASS